MSKIKEILKDDNSVLVFDIDGVLAIMEWGEYHHYIADDYIWANMYSNGECYYTEEYVSKKMQDFLKMKNKSRVYIITKAFSQNEANDKMNFAFKYYGIPKENLFYVEDNMEKYKILFEIKKKYPELPDHNLVMIDDTVDVLTSIMDKTPFSTAHVSSFLDI